MFTRKLTALDYPLPIEFNVNGKSGYSVISGLVDDTPVG
jgi:hypothetical protein